MKIAISGSTGFIGGALREAFVSSGIEVVPLLRADFKRGENYLVQLLTGVDGIINLAGAPIVKRWTQSYKQEIMESRIKVTRQLVGALKAMSTDDRPEMFLSASAIGIYANSGTHDEEVFEYGHDFLGEVATRWEGAASEVEALGVRLVIMRMGLVLGKDGGMFGRLLPIFRMGLGGTVASGKQGFSFIHLDDVVGAVQFLLAKKELKGVFNFTAPYPVNNETFTRKLARKLGRPSFMAVPAFALKLVFSEGATALSHGPTVLPRKLSEAGYKFQFPDIDSALDDLIKP